MSTSTDTQSYGTLTGADPDTDTDPYSNVGLYDELQTLVQAIITGLKAHKDESTSINRVMYDMQTWGSNVVGQDSESQTAMTKYLTGVSRLQGYLNCQTEKADIHPVDPQTGEIDKSKSVNVEQAIIAQTEYLLNNPMTKTIKKQVNPAFRFFNHHSSLYDSIKTNLTSVISALTDGGGRGGAISGTPPNCTVWVGYGAVKNMWDRSKGGIDPKGGTQPDPSILNQVTSAMGSVNQSYTSGSSAMQAVAKTNTQTYNAEQGNLNKFLQAMVTLMKAMVQGQKTQ